MVVWRSVGMTRNIPAGREYQEIGEGCGWVTGACCQDAKDRWVDVVNRNRPDIDKLRKVILVGNLDSE